MSVTTTADEKLRSAKDHLSQAYNDILIVLNEDTYGHDEYHADYLDKLHEIALSILKLKRTI